MTALPTRVELPSPEEYLASEESSPVRHEYLGGEVYSMAGGSNAHNAIATNALVSIGAQLRGKRCRPFNSDTKVRIQFPTHTRFYYPDSMIVCQPSDAEKHYQDAPSVIIEVLSESTRRTDEQEKREAYLTIPTLRCYVLLEQDGAAATVWRRTEQGFVRETIHGLDSVVALTEIDASLPLAEVYEGVELSMGNPNP
jgi:Uma2 family endonuclease